MEGSGRGIDLSGGSTSAPAGFGSGPTSGGYTGGGGGGGAGGYGGGFGNDIASAAMQHPMVQQQVKDEAYRQGREHASYAGAAAMQAGSSLREYVQGGPAGVSILCFMGGGVTCVVGLLGLLNLGALFTPFHYVLNLYLTGFGFISILLEADPERLGELAVIGKLAPLVQSYQKEVFERAKFLTELRGRGLFYLFVGTLAGSQCLVCLTFLCGLWNVLMGVLCLMMSFGINPADHIPHDRLSQMGLTNDPPSQTA